ncbi:MAG: Ig-like domain-containing protein [Candidatus Onthovivens sp.]|nr:Ig-like domain-containing protein [Candidatus Onthovivens sp.]
MKKTTKFLFLFLFISSISFSLFSCDDNTPTIDNTPSIVIKNEDLITLEIGDTHQLEVETINYDGDVTFLSRNSSIASVSNDGLIRANSAGETIIYARIDDCFDKVSVKVNEEKIDVKRLYISLDVNEVKVNSTLNINTSVYPINANNYQIEYEITSGQNLITIENNKIYTLKSGDVILVAKANDVISNEISLNIYDFNVELSKSVAKVNEKIYLSIDDNFKKYSFGIETNNNGIISLGVENNSFYIVGNEVGEVRVKLCDYFNEIYSNYFDIKIVNEESYEDIPKDEFYKNYVRATSNEDAKKRSEAYLMSGNLEVDDQVPIISNYQKVEDGKLVHNNNYYYKDENTYVAVDCYGNEVFEVYKDGAYITLEEVAAYIYAFGDVPTNYYENRYNYPYPSESPWGEYLRLNNNEFSGDTDKFPYEPILPRISGCGGDLIYYEVDIGTTGTDCDPRYPSEIYNDGYSITRGAARIVYSRYYESDGSLITSLEDRYVFYTYNHYNDFQEYLNYQNGWGEMFGNITGGGDISSYDPNFPPTDYVPSIRSSLK